ncbi:MAG TPA: hypothetical protein VGN90_03195 [Pyrinomonadaceae bacterium]|nr:hypothetical protein [Pyrinomonadaceae bacterium]
MKSTSFTGWAFSGGNTLDDLPAAVGVAEKADAPFTSGVGEDSVLVVAEVAALLSVNCVAAGAGVADGNWACASGKKQNRMAAAKARRFMVVESLPEYCQIKAAIYIDKDATRTAGVNRPRLAALFAIGPSLVCCSLNRIVRTTCVSGWL